MSDRDMAAVLGKLDVDLVGVARLEDWKGTPLEEHARRLLPGASSVVVVGVPIYREVLEHCSPGRSVDGAKMSELLDAHSEFLNRVLDTAIYRIGAASHAAGFKALPLPARGFPYNSRKVASIFSFKGAARAAGLGSIGRHSLVITPQFGPKVRFACCLTEGVLEPAASSPAHDCSNCRVCIDKCPAGAISVPEPGEPFRLNRFACTAFRAGGHCVECLRACPAGK